PEPSPDQYEEAADVPDLELAVSGFRLEWMESPWDDVAAAGEWLLDLERRVRPDVVHLNGYSHGALPWSAPVVIAGHSCVCSWADAVGQWLDADYWCRYREAVRRGLQRADWVATPSTSMLSTLERHYGPIERASVVPNGRDARRFRTAH